MEELNNRCTLSLSHTRMHTPKAHACTQRRKEVICSTSLACIVASGRSMLKGEMSPPWIEHQSAESGRGKAGGWREGKCPDGWGPSAHAGSVLLAFFFFFFSNSADCPFSATLTFTPHIFLQIFGFFSFPINSLKLEILLLIIVYMEPFLHGHRHVSLRCCSGTQWSLLSHLAAIAGFWDPNIHILYFWIDVINRPHQTIRCIRRDKSVLNLSHATR